MIEERQPVRAHKISLLNRNLGVITGVKDVVSFDLNEIIIDDQREQSSCKEIVGGERRSGDYR